MPESFTQRLLLQFRASVPSATGVVLAGPDGRAVASDLAEASDVPALIAEAGGARGAGESAFVGTVLVVFLPGSTLLGEAATAAA